MLRNVLSRAVLFTLVCVAFASYAVAVPLALTHQGRLLDASDTPLNGVYTIIYTIHDAEVGGTQLWMEDHVGVVVTDGLFSVVLGETVPLSADVLAGHGGGGGGGGSLRYLQVQLSGQPPIMPRTQLVSTPYSVASIRVDGDLVTAPGELHMFNADSAVTLDIEAKEVSGKKKVKFRAGAELAGSVNRREVSISTDADTAGIAIDESGVHRLLALSTGSGGGSGGSVSLSLSNVCCLGSSGEDGVGLFSDETSNRVAIKTKGTGADANRVVSSQTAATPFDVTQMTSIDDDGDTVPESEISQTVTPTTCGVAIKVKGTGAENNRTAGSSCDDSMAVHYLDIDDDGDGIAEGHGIISVKSATGTGSMSASSRLSCDPDEDGDQDSEISQIVTPTTCSVAIKVKGTGAENNRTAGSSCDDSMAVHYLDMDDDGDGISEAGAVSAVSSLSGGGGGAATTAAYARWYTDSDDDGVPDNEISQIVTPTTCGVAIKTKGTGADANRTAQHSSTTEVGEISTVSTLDEDGDGLSESSISQRIAPTTSSLAIKTKGTSAQRTQTISGDCDDESSVFSLDTDDDGDGISDSKVVVASGASLLGGALPGGAVISSRYDSDDDGVAEQEFDQIVTPTTCSVAIKTKGTGADANRVIGGTDDTTATVFMATDSASISMKVRKGGNVNGSIVINNGSALRMVEIGSGGNGYFASGVGVGVDPTHHIDVVGGAYCDGTNWVNASDKNSKENFEQVNGEEILEKISDLEITKWNYKGDDDAQHIGPTAQDFKKTFGVGADDKSISTIDPSGIALAAIKELYALLQAKDKEMKELREEMAKLKKEIDKKK